MTTKSKATPEEPITKLAFHNLSSRTPQNKPILKQISGQFHSASFVAILGSSGAGKTTLLNILSGFHPQNATCDKLEVDGSPCSFGCLSNVSCYLTQDIHLNDLLTVQENMRYAAEFKLAGKCSETDKGMIVEEVLDSFGLSSVLHTRAEALSGGERKRLALALEMISDPDIVFLDEPTTGLDISSAQQILTFLRKIADNGKTVICTIHQVSASHLKLFDQVYVISDGQCAYQGRPEDMVAFLEAQGLFCSINHNPADYIIELCSGDYGPDKSNLLIDASRNGRDSSQHNLEGKAENDVKVPSKYAAISWWKQFGVLLHREAKKTTRNTILIPMRLLSSYMIALILGCVYWDVGNDASKIISNYKLVLCLVANVFLTGMLYPILWFPLEMQLVKREHHNRYYTILQYYLATFILDLPITLVASSTSAMLAWYMTSQPMVPYRIAVFQLFILLFGCVVNAIGHFFGTLNLPMVPALILCVFTQLPQLLISGYGLLFKDMHWLVVIASRTSYIRQGVEGALVAIFGVSERKLVCPEEEVYCFYKDPRKLLTDIGLDPYHFGHCFYILFLWFCVVRILTYFMMRYRLTL